MKKSLLVFSLFCVLSLCNLSGDMFFNLQQPNADSVKIKTDANTKIANNIFANNAIFELLQNKFGLANMPVGIEYERVVEGPNIDAKKQVLYTPNAKCKVFTDGKGRF